MSGVETISNVDEEAPTDNVDIVPSIPVDARIISHLPKKRKASTNLDDDGNDEGSTCSICFDEWDIAGVHRLTSLKCGHLFGWACIQRWLEDSSPDSRSCPRCNKSASKNDFRYIYPKTVTANDNSEVERLRKQLKFEREKSAKIAIESAANLKFEQDKYIDMQERLSVLQEMLATYNDSASIEP